MGNQLDMSEDFEDGPNLERAELFADGARGVFIPQHFAESVIRDKVTGVTAEQWAELESARISELYWEAWDLRSE